METSRIGSNRRRRFATFGMVLILTAFWAAITVPLYPGAMKTDFLCFFTGMRMAWDGDFRAMYDTRHQSDVQNTICPEQTKFQVFPRPPFFALLWSPLAALPLNKAFIAWVALEISLLLGCWWWACRRWGDDALLWAAFSFPAMVGIAYGQDTSFMLAVSILGYALADRKREFAGGAVWALGLVKLNLLLVLPVALLATRRWRLLGVAPRRERSRESQRQKVSR